MVKKILGLLLMSGVIAVFGSATQVQAAGHAGAGDYDQEQASIVGSWTATLDNGERLLFSFTADRIALSSVQSEVSLTRPVLTPAHGVWAQAGRRKFAMTTMVVLYDLQT